MRIMRSSRRQQQTPAADISTDTRPQGELSLSRSLGTGTETERNARLLTKMENISDGDSQPRSVNRKSPGAIGTWHLAWPAVSSARSLGPMGSWSVLSLLIVIAIKKNRTGQPRKNKHASGNFFSARHFGQLVTTPSYPQRSNPVTHAHHTLTSIRLGQIADNSHPVIPCFGFAGQGRLKSSNPRTRPPSSVQFPNPSLLIQASFLARPFVWRRYV